MRAFSGIIRGMNVVTLKGMYYVVYTYQTTMDSNVSVPALLATDIKK